MNKNDIILAVVLSLLGMAALGWLYSCFWRHSLRADIVHVRGMRQHGSDLESQRHAVPEVRSKNRSQESQRGKGRNAKQEPLDQHHAVAVDVPRGKGKGRQAKVSADGAAGERDKDRVDPWENERRERKPDDTNQSGDSTADSEWARNVNDTTSEVSTGGWTASDAAKSSGPESNAANSTWGCEGNDTASEISTGGWTANDAAKSSGSESNAADSEWDREDSLQSQGTNTATKSWSASDGMSPGGSDGSAAKSEWGDVSQDKSESGNTTPGNGPESRGSELSAFKAEWGGDSRGQTTHYTSPEWPSGPEGAGTQW